MKTILCVDDHDVNLFTLEAIFQEHQDKYKIITAESGREALSILLNQSVDMILLDIMMPQMDGYETARLIKSNKKTKNIPIIFLTAKKDQDTVAECYAVGGVDYLLKPYNAQELFARVNFHLEMVEHKNQLEYERAFTQEILDMQDNLLLLFEANSIMRVNKRVLEFFDVQSRIELIESIECFCHVFIKKEDYFYLEASECDKNWLKRLESITNEKELLVLIEDKKAKAETSFTIKINKIDQKYLLTLTDVSLLVKESQENKLAASMDPLTQLNNRSKFNDAFEIVATQAREDEAFSLIMFDIDHFKEVNDTYGHLVGDEVLVKLSELIQSHTRESDIFARWGGEEFMILLKGAKLQKAKNIAEYLRTIIEVEHFNEVNNITCSFGVSSYKLGDDIASITKRVDEALYESKETGRNKVSTAP